MQPAVSVGRSAGFRLNPILTDLSIAEIAGEKKEKNLKRGNLELDRDPYANEGT